MAYTRHPLAVSANHTVRVKGEPLFAGRLNHWLAEQNDDSAAYGPVHLNLGLNARAMLTQHPEFEKLRGTVCCGIGDSSLLVRMWHGMDIEPNVSDMHWDILLMRPTLTLDDTVLCKDGFIVKNVEHGEVE